MDDDAHPTDDDPATGLPMRPDAAALPDAARLGAALASVLEQQALDAAATRAHARELVRAVEGLAKSHEFLGLELRAERRRTRRLLAAVWVAPLLLALGGWALWARIDAADERVVALRTSLEQDVTTLRDRRSAEREAEIRREFEERVVRLEEEATAAREDLERSRRALGEERTDRDARERTAAERLARAERELAELTALRAESRSLRDVLGVERARADALARALADAARPVATTAAPPTPPATDGRRLDPVGPEEAAAAPAVPGGRASESPSAAVGEAPVALPPAPPAAPPEASPVADRPSPPAPTTASQNAQDLERIRGALNSLLEAAAGGARYSIEGLEGVAGTDLRGVRVVGRDATGRTLRTVEAPSATISVAADGAVQWRFTDGHLVIGGRRAPFFDGVYTISLEGRFAAWRDSGLTCIRLP